MPPRSTAANVNAEDQEPQSTYGALQADSPLPADTLSNLMGKEGLMGQSVPLRPDWALRFLKVERRWEIDIKPILCGSNGLSSVYRGLKLNGSQAASQVPVHKFPPNPRSTTPFPEHQFPQSTRRPENHPTAERP